MSGFTKGPWTAAPTGPRMRGYSQPFGVAQIGTPTLVAGVFGDIPGGEVTAEANARLVASAPEMYEALKAMLDFFAPAEGQRVSIDAVMRAEYVLAKIDGETR